MNKLLRACVALVSFALTSALFGNTFSVQINSGESMHFQFTGNTSGEFHITKLGAGGGLAAIVFANPAGNGWPASYNDWSAAPYQSGTSFSAASPSYQATLSGLSPGDYQVTAYGNGGYFTENYHSHYGSTAYSYQSSNNGLYADFSFEVY